MNPKYKKNLSSDCLGDPNVLSNITESNSTEAFGFSTIISENAQPEQPKGNIVRPDNTLLVENASISQLDKVSSKLSIPYSTKNLDSLTELTSEHGQKIGKNMSVTDKNSPIKVSHLQLDICCKDMHNASKSIGYSAPLSTTTPVSTSSPLSFIIVDEPPSVAAPVLSPTFILNKDAPAARRFHSKSALTASMSVKSEPIDHLIKMVRFHVTEDSLKLRLFCYSISYNILKILLSYYSKLSLIYQLLYIYIYISIRFILVSHIPLLIGKW